MRDWNSIKNKSRTFCASCRHGMTGHAVRLSVVIPRWMPTCPAGALAAIAAPFVEVIVADGGSRDGTAALAHRHGATVIAAPRGSGSQLCAGARAAPPTWLMFLHADSAPAAAGARRSARSSLTPGTRAGRLSPLRARRRIGSGAAAGAGGRLALPRLALPYGDQGLVIGRASTSGSAAPADPADGRRRCSRGASGGSGWCRFRPPPSPRPRATGAAATCAGRCATSPALGSTSPACLRH